MSHKKLLFHKKKPIKSNKNLFHCVSLHSNTPFEYSSVDYSKFNKYMFPLDKYLYEKNPHKKSTIFNLAILYYDGIGVKQDYIKALELYEKGILLGCHSSAFNLAHMYLNGIGVQQDYIKALELINLCISLKKNGDGDAYATLGLIYKHGYGVKKDHNKAVKFLKKACDKNNTWAMFTMAFMYRNGDGVGKNIDMAIDLYKKLINLGEYKKTYLYLGNVYHDLYLNSNSNSNSESDSKSDNDYDSDYDSEISEISDSEISDCEINDINNESEISEISDNENDNENDNSESEINNDNDIEFNYSEMAISLYKTAIKYGEYTAYGFLSEIYNERKEYKKFIKCLKQSCLYGDSIAMYSLGYKYLYGIHVEQNSEKALYYFKQASYLGNTDAINKIGDIYYLGTYYIKKDHIKAKEYYEKGIALNNTKSMNMLGHMYKNGDGVKQDYNKAFIYYKKSADNGNNIGMELLGNIYLYKSNHQYDKYERKAIKLYEKSYSLGNTNVYYKIRNNTSERRYINKYLSIKKKYNNLQEENTKLKEELNQYVLEHTFKPNGIGAKMVRDHAHKLRSELFKFD